MECLPAHAWVGEDFIGFLGLDNNRLRLRGGPQHQHHNEGKSGHGDFLLAMLDDDH